MLPPVLSASTSRQVFDEVHDVLRAEADTATNIAVRISNALITVAHAGIGPRGLLLRRCQHQLTKGISSLAQLHGLTGFPARTDHR